MSKSLIISSKRPDFIEVEIKELLKIFAISENSPDFLKLDNRNKQSIGVEDTKFLKAWLLKKPYSSKNKLAVIYNSDKLTIEAQNSILKQLEEPSDNSYIVLACENYSSLLPTVLSRCELIFDKEMLQTVSVPFLELKFKDKLKFIEEILSIKNISDREKKIKNFLKNISIELEQKLRAGDRSEAIINNIMLVERTIKMIDSNTSRRLALENLVLNMEELIC